MIDDTALAELLAMPRQQRIVIRAVDGHEQLLGRKLRFQVIDGVATASGRRNVYASAIVETVEKIEPGAGWLLTMVDGSTWRVTGCGCGG